MNRVKNLRLYPLNSEYKPLKDFTLSDLFFRMITLLVVWTEGQGPGRRYTDKLRAVESFRTKTVEN